MTAQRKQVPAEQHTDLPLLITFQRAAEILGAVSVRHIERLVAARKLRRVGVGRARRIVYASILDYIEREGGHG